MEENEDRRERPVLVEFNKDSGYSNWLTKHQPQLLTKILTPANGFLTPSNVNVSEESDIPYLPEDIGRRIWKQSNDILVKEKQDYCQEYNESYEEEETIKRCGIRVPIPDGRCYGLDMQTIRFVKYTMEGGEVWQDDCLLGNCPRCFAVGPVLYYCRESDCRCLNGVDTRFRLIRFRYEWMGRPEYTIFVHPYKMARYARKYFGMFNFRPLPPPLNKQDPHGLRLTKDDALRSIINWRAEDFLVHCYQMNLSMNQGDIKKTGPYRWTKPAFRWTNIPDTVYELIVYELLLYGRQERANPEVHNLERFHHLR